MRNPKVETANLKRLADTIIAESEELDASHAEPAVETVRAVTGHAIWKRACAAKRRFVEAPFTVLETGEGETLVRGTIDLVFEEEDGWVVVDYKTDAVPNVEKYAPQVRYYAEVWKRFTGEKVKERALFFTRTGKLEPV